MDIALVKSSEGVTNPGFQDDDGKELQKVTVLPLVNLTLTSKTLPEDKLTLTSKIDFNENETDIQNENQKEGKPARRGWAKYIGMMFTLLASLLSSFSTLIVKVLNTEDKFHSYTSSFWRFFGVLVPSIPLLLAIEFRRSKSKEDSVFSTIWPLIGHSSEVKEKWHTLIGLLIRGTVMSSSIIFRYYSLHYLSIGDTMVISYSTPIFVTVLAHFFLKEKLGVIPIVGSIVALVGVVIMTRPPFITGAKEYDYENLIGVGLATASLVCMSIAFILLRKIRTVHFSVMMVAFGLIGVVQTFSLAEFSGVFKFPSTNFQISLIGALMSIAFLAQMATILGLKFEQAGPVSLLRSADIIFAYILQFIFLGVNPDELSFVGGLTIMSAIVVIGLRKWLTTLPEHDSRRQKYKILLL